MEHTYTYAYYNNGNNSKRKSAETETATTMYSSTRKSVPLESLDVLSNTNANNGQSSCESIIQYNYDNMPPLKRANNSSMFSIATLPAIHSHISMIMNDSDDSSSSSALNLKDALLIESESDDDVVIIEEELATHHPRHRHHHMLNNINRTGLVILASELHYDVKNRFHKERPLRVKAIRDYLANTPLSSSFTNIDSCCTCCNYDHDDDDDCKESVVKAGSYDCDHENCIIHGKNGKKSLLENCVVLADDVIEKDLNYIEAEFLCNEDLLSVHLPGYIKRMETVKSSITNCNGNQAGLQERLDREAAQYKSIYLTKHSLDLAKTAASLLCKIVSKVMTGELDVSY